MAKKLKNKGADNTVDKGLDNVGGENTPITPQNPSKDASVKALDIPTDYLDSETGDIGASLTSILNVPTETITSTETVEDKSDVLQGFNTPSSNGSNSGDSSSESDLDDFTDLGGDDDDSPFFEDNELLAEIGIELIDMMMTYGAMAIAKDFDNEEKYAIKDKRKKKLQAPLEKILQNRDVKTSPELVFCFMMIVIYSPMYITAVKERKEKKEEANNIGAPAPRSKAVVSPLPSNKKDDISIMPEPNSELENGDDSQHPLSDMLSNMKPKRKAGRPVGSTDLNPRKNLDENERGRQIEKAKALRKDGWSFARIGKELNVSEGTATRWVRKAK